MIKDNIVPITDYNNFTKASIVNELFAILVVVDTSSDKDYQYVLVLPDGTKPKDLHGAFETFLKSINLYTSKQGKKYSLYSLHQTYATRKLLAGTLMHLLARQMGTSTAMLEAHYSKVTARMSASLFG